MLVRIPGARHSQDVDLLHPGTDIIGAVDELRALSVRPDLDRFTFEIEAKGSLTGVSRGAQLKATVYLGTTRVGNFPIDIAIERTLIGPVERLQPRPAVEIADVSTLPAFTVVPIADQIADKLCAMYELHGPQKVTPSTRFRDLVDLLLIITSCTVDAEDTVNALRAQQTRRVLTLPPHACISRAELGRRLSCTRVEDIVEIRASYARRRTRRAQPCTVSIAVGAEIHRDMGPRRAAVGAGRARLRSHQFRYLNRLADRDVGTVRNRKIAHLVGVTAPGQREQRVFEGLSL